MHTHSEFNELVVKICISIERKAINRTCFCLLLLDGYHMPTLHNGLFRSSFLIYILFLHFVIKFPELIYQFTKQLGVIVDCSNVFAVSTVKNYKLSNLIKSTVVCRVNYVCLTRDSLCTVNNVYLQIVYTWWTTVSNSFFTYIAHSVTERL